MFKKIKNIISKIDIFLYKTFGSEKKLYFLENLKEAKIIFSIFNETEKQDKVRFVGGCIRKALCGDNIDDLDLATTLKPDEVKSKLTKANIKVIDTGISHGTVTAILNKVKFEITTLRKDVSTDGRHANVEFTSDWTQDALRRDFTINAIYADINGKIFDPQDGVSDLQNGKIKFIGLPTERIQEDYLRILRYLRFFTQYSNEDHDQNAISIIKQNINGLNKISNERIFDELKKILLLKNVYNLFLHNQTKEIILSIFPQFKYFERLNKIGSLDKKLKDKYDSCLILALFIVDQSNNYEYFCYKYKISNEIKDRFKNISENFENLRNKKFYLKENIKKLIYLKGKNTVKDLLLFSECAINQIETSKIEELIDYVITYKIPKFPISGDDLKKHGYKSGPMLGKELKLLEQKWIENNFVIDQKIIKKSLEKVKQN